MTETASVPFRSATAAPAADATAAMQKPSGEQMRASKGFDDAPPSLSMELDKKAYAIKHLGLDLYNDDPSFVDVREQAAALDAYVNKQIKARGMKDSAESYKEVVEAIYKQIGKSTNEEPTKALKRLSVAAGALARLSEAKLEPVLSAKSLTPTEFEEVQA